MIPQISVTQYRMADSGQSFIFQILLPITSTESHYSIFFLLMEEKGYEKECQIAKHFNLKNDLFTNHALSEN